MDNSSQDDGRDSDLHDHRGVPICKGDLVKQRHFYCRSERRWYYVYHTAVFNDRLSRIKLVPTSHLEPSLINEGGDHYPSQDQLDATKAEVIMGHGPGDILSFRDRPRSKV